MRLQHCSHKYVKVLQVSWESSKRKSFWLLKKKKHIVSSSEGVNIEDPVWGDFFTSLVFFLPAVSQTCLSVTLAPRFSKAPRCTVHPAVMSQRVFVIISPHQVFNPCSYFPFLNTFILFLILNWIVCQSLAVCGPEPVHSGQTNIDRVNGTRISQTTVTTCCHVWSDLTWLTARCESNDRHLRPHSTRQTKATNSSECCAAHGFHVGETNDINSTRAALLLQMSDRRWLTVRCDCLLRRRCHTTGVLADNEREKRCIGSDFDVNAALILHAPTLFTSSRQPWRLLCLQLASHY